MRKRPVVALVTTAENTRAQLIDDTTNQQYWFVQTAAGAERILGPIPYGKTVRYIATDPQREVRSTILVGGATVEVVAASTRYSIDIWNPDATYESMRRNPMRYSATSAAALSGTASTDRYNVYYSLVGKINAVAENNVTAYGLTKATYTLGTSTGDAATNFVVGETVTQETSTLTAQVAACSIATGTFAADNAAGDIWLYNLSAYTGWLETAKTLTAAGTAAATTLTAATTNCVVTVTNATTLHYQGIVTVDDAGYFIAKQRGGVNRVAVVAGFATATATSIINGQYAIGIGSEMLQRLPVFDIGNQAVISGTLEYDFQAGVLPVSGQTYERIVIEVKDGDEDALDGRKVETLKHYILWFNDSSHADYTHDLLTALDTVVAK
jgi:hypothetical protein